MAGFSINPFRTIVNVHWPGQLFYAVRLRVTSPSPLPQVEDCDIGDVVAHPPTEHPNLYWEGGNSLMKVDGGGFGIHRQFHVYSDGNWSGSGPALPEGLHDSALHTGATINPAPWDFVPNKIADTNPTVDITPEGDQVLNGNNPLVAPNGLPFVSGASISMAFLARTPAGTKECTNYGSGDIRMFYPEFGPHAAYDTVALSIDITATINDVPHTATAVAYPTRRLVNGGIATIYALMTADEE